MSVRILNFARKHGITPAAAALALQIIDETN